MEHFGQALSQLPPLASGGLLVAKPHCPRPTGYGLAHHIQQRAACCTGAVGNDKQRWEH
jgi:hypothetical protein